MTGTYQPLPTEYPQSAKPVRKPRHWPWILGVIGALILGVVIGSAGRGGGITSLTATTTTVTASAPARAAPTLMGPPVPPAAASGPKTEFGDGKFKVGADIAAGSYKSTGPRAGSVLPSCYWARMKDDSGSVGSIIGHDISQGPTRLTVKTGEYLQVAGCDFTKA